MPRKKQIPHKFFCYWCKKHIEIFAESKKKAEKAFKDQGHSEEKVAFLEPDVGRSRRRVERARDLKLRDALQSPPKRKKVKIDE